MNKKTLCQKKKKKKQKKEMNKKTLSDVPGNRSS